MKNLCHNHSVSFNYTLAACVLLLVGTISRPAQAQNVTFAGAQVTIPTVGLHCPRGVSVDGAGDVFIADSNDSRIVEVPAGGVSQFNVGTGLNGPNGVTVDGAGDIYVADSRNNRVAVFPADGAAQFTVASGLKDPGGVALDGAGDVFIADTENNRVVEVPAGGGPQFTVGSRLQDPRDVACDENGDVFIADTLNNRVVEVQAGGGDQITLPAVGLNKPSGVALDAAGDLFISDLGNGRVLEIPANGETQVTLPTSGVTYPYGVAVDGMGDVFIVNYGAPTTKCPEPGEPVTNFMVVEVQTAAVNFGKIALNSGNTLTLNYNVAATTVFGTINLVSQGEPSLDFTASNSSTCAGSVSAGSSCTVNVSFAPITLGERTAEAQLTDSSGNVLVTTSLSGVGAGTAVTTLSSDHNPSVPGEAVTFTATVTPAPPDGELVRFEQNNTVLGTGSLADGKASFVTSTLVGVNRIQAVYGGDWEVIGSPSNTVAQVVKK